MNEILAQAAAPTLQTAVVRQADAERTVVDAVTCARVAGHWSWNRVGEVLGTSGEAARQG